MRRAPDIDHGTALRDGAKRLEPDRYAAALLAPRAVRDDLISLAAFAGDIGAIANQVSDPMLGEIRFQWWRDALERSSGDLSGNPIADAAAAAFRRHHIEPAMVARFLDRHAHKLYADPPADAAEVTRGLQDTEGVAFTIAARMLGVPDRKPVAEAIDAAARAYGLTRLALQLPLTLARGRDPLPEQNGTEREWRQEVRKLAADTTRALAECRASLHGAPAALNTAILPLAVVEPYFRALQRHDFDPAHDVAEIAPLARVWRIWRAHVRGSI